MNRRLAATLLVVVWLTSFAPGAAADEPRQAAREFDLRPFLSDALFVGLTEAEVDPVTDPLLRHRRTAASMMPAMSETGGGSGGSAARRRPGDWLVGGFDKTSRWVTAGLFVGLGGYLILADRDDARLSPGRA